MQQSERSLDVYTRLMGELKMRLSILERNIGRAETGKTYRNEEVVLLESRCLQLRKVLELLAFSSLVAHRELLAQVHEDLATMQKAKNVIKRLEKRSPHFFPNPVRGVVTPQGLHFKERTGSDVFTKEDFIPLFDACSGALHIANPLSSSNPINIGRPFREWIERIKNLLQEHSVLLSQDKVIFVNMLAWDITQVQVFSAEADR